MKRDLEELPNQSWTDEEFEDWMRRYHARRAIPACFILLLMVAVFIAFYWVANYHADWLGYPSP